MIRDSRIKSTKLLTETISKLQNPPALFISASGINFYGNDTGDQLQDEGNPAGSTGFLTQLCYDWEHYAYKLTKLDIRIVTLRYGIVLSPDGGALGMMTFPFRWCLGGVIGSGSQWFSWISMVDTLRAIQFVIENSNVSGPVNIVAPNAVTNYVFTKTLGAALHRPTVCWVPTWILKASYWIVGDAVYDMFLASIRVHPKTLLDHGFYFKHPDLATYLNSCYE